MKHHLLLRIADEDDVANIVSLLNTCYRGGQGWTTEAGMVAGERIDEDTVAGMLAAKRHFFFVFENMGHDVDSALLGCIVMQLDVRSQGDVAHIEMVAVHPEVQKQGVGGEMLKQVEAFAKAHLGQGWVKMQVIESRRELLAYYERRGYEKSGVTGPLPDWGYQQPIADNLHLVELHKRLLD